MPYNFNSNLYKNASFLKKECSREEKSKIKEEDKKPKGKKQSSLKSVFILGIILILSRNTFGTVEKLSIEEFQEIRRKECIGSLVKLKKE